MDSPFSLVGLCIGLLRTTPPEAKPALFPAFGEFLAALICLHLATPAVVYGLLNSEAGTMGIPVDALQPHIRASLRGVLAAMVEGRVAAHSCMAGADVGAASAAVMRCLPAIAAGTTRLCTAPDQARAVLTVVEGVHARG